MPEALTAFRHTSSSCALWRAERDTLDADRARLRRRGAAVRHRAATPAERVLIKVSGVHLDRREPLHVRVEWPTPDERRRTFTRARLVSITAVSS